MLVILNRNKKYKQHFLRTGLKFTEKHLKPNFALLDKFRHSLLQKTLF